MDYISDLSERVLASFENKEERSLTYQIDWDHRIIGIKGIRGSGKTTFLKNRIKLHLAEPAKPLYVSLDNFYFLKNSIVDCAESFALKGGTHLFLDDVHKYPNWIADLKFLHKELPHLKIVFSHLSNFALKSDEAELGKRVKIYSLDEMSFREYLNIKHGLQLPSFTLENLLKDHREIALMCKNKINFPIAEFNEYLLTGCYPFGFDGVLDYDRKLMDFLNIVIEADIRIVENITFADSLKIKKILLEVAENNPLKPNISRLSNTLGISRTFLLNAIKILEHSGLIQAFYPDHRKIGNFTRPLKLYLHNTNIVYAFQSVPIKQDVINETFLINQLRKSSRIHLNENSGFLVDRKYSFIMGSKNDINPDNRENTFLLCDDLEVGKKNLVPLYLFGMLY